MDSKHNLNLSPDPLSEEDESDEATARARRHEAKIFTIILSLGLVCCKNLPSRTLL